MINGLTRKKILLVWGIIYAVLTVVGVAGLETRKKNFSYEKLEKMMMTTATDRDKTTDWCKYVVLGEPKEPDGDWVKINFWCAGDKNSRSTLSLRAIEDKSLGGVLKEYARIVGVDGEMTWECRLNEKKMIDNWEILVKKTDRIDCYEENN